jgi:hypothetical protein
MEGAKLAKRKSDSNALVFTRPEQRAIVIEALKVFPNVSVVYQHLGKLIGISYGTVWNIAKSEGIKLIRLPPRWRIIHARSERSYSASEASKWGG